VRFPTSKARGAARRAFLGLEATIQRSGHTLAALDRWNARRLTRQWRLEQRPRHPKLADYEKRIYSQNGEDGLIEALFQRIGVTNRFFVEIGASDGSENCTRYLAQSGWQGVWMEADASKAGIARTVVDDRVRVVQATVRRDNVVALLSEASVPERPDLLVLDIDGNDWWVLDSLLHSFQPRVLVVEYNGSFHPGQSWVRRYRPNLYWDGTFRHGASLSAMNDLAVASGLTLVGCDSNGVNAFFVDAAEASKVGVANLGDVQRQHVGPWFASSLWGHPRRSAVDEVMLPMSESELESLSVTDLRRIGSSGPVRPGQPISVSVRISNRSTRTLTSGDPAPVHLGLSWEQTDTSAKERHEPRRAELTVPVPSGRNRRAAGWIAAPPEPGKYRLVVTMVQENVAWLSTNRPDSQVGIIITVVAPPP
jgi:hypothetical protein